MSILLNKKTLIYNTVEKVESYWKGFKPVSEVPTSYQDKWIANLPILEKISMDNNLFIVLWDAQVNRFIIAYDKNHITGYDIEDYLAENGIEWSLSNIHEDYLNATLVMQKKGFEYYAQDTSAIVSFDFLYQKKDGNYFKMLQQAIQVETDGSGHPILILSHIYDISHLKKEMTSNLIISYKGSYDIYNYNFDSNILEKVKPFTDQEIKVLKALSEGKHTKQIATELAISPHTIDTHRRHLLTKTNCVDTTALITYAKMTGII